MNITKILLVCLFIVSIIFLGRSLIYLVRHKKSDTSKHKVVNNLGLRVIFSVLLIATLIVLLITGEIVPNNPLKLHSNNLSSE